MKAGITYINDRYFALANAFHSIRVVNKRIDKMVTSEKDQKYLRKLVKAHLCILVRKTIDCKLFSIFHSIKFANNLRRTS